MSISKSTIKILYKKIDKHALSHEKGESLFCSLAYLNFFCCDKKLLRNVSIYTVTNVQKQIRRQWAFFLCSAMFLISKWCPMHSSWSNFQKIASPKRKLQIVFFSNFFFYLKQTMRSATSDSTKPKQTREPNWDSTTAKKKSFCIQMKNGLFVLKRSTKVLAVLKSKSPAVEMNLFLFNFPSIKIKRWINLMFILGK